MINKFWVFIILVAMVCSASAENFTYTESKKDGFTLSLPDSWIPVPLDIMDEFTESNHKAAPNIEKQVFKYGFQLKDNEKWLSIPRILVQVNNSGRMPLSEFKKFKTIKQTMENSIVDFKEKTSDLINNISFNEPVLDEEKRMLIMTYNMETSLNGKLQGLSTIILTEKGNITLHFYAAEAQFDSYSTSFINIANSIVLNDSLKYTVREFDGIPFLENIDWGNVLLYAILGAVLSPLVGWIKRKFTLPKS